MQVEHASNVVRKVTCRVNALAVVVQAVTLLGDLVGSAPVLVEGLVVSQVVSVGNAFITNAHEFMTTGRFLLHPICIRC